MPGAKRDTAVERTVEGLRRLGQLGHDSVGLAVAAGQTTQIYKSPHGDVAGLSTVLEERKSEWTGPTARDSSWCSAVGHCRWATHGPPTMANCHPHVSGDDHRFVIVHNGIVTNYGPLRTQLAGEGYSFHSDTDTEVVAKLMDFVYAKLIAERETVTFKEVVADTMALVDGANAIVAMSSAYPGELTACAIGSPLVLGFQFVSSEDDPPVSPGRLSYMTLISLCQERPVEFFISSAPAALAKFTGHVIDVETQDIVHLSSDGSIDVVKMSRINRSPDDLPPQIRRLDRDLDEAEKGDFPHYLLKEIFEQPESIVNTMRGRCFVDKEAVILGGLAKHAEIIRDSNRLVFIACATSYHAAVAVRELVEELTGIPVMLETASDFLDRQGPILRGDTCVLISRSGETSDTLECLARCKAAGAVCVGVTNTVDSTLSRETHCGVHLNAGREIGIASTKGFTSQIVALVLIALFISKDSIAVAERRKAIINALNGLPDLIKETLKLNSKIEKIAKEMYEQRSLLVMGRGFQHATCLEGARKVKELSYMHSEGILAGELKHGPLALIDENLAIIIIATRDKLFQDKVFPAIKQVTARHGRPIILCHPDDVSQFQDLDTPPKATIVVPKTVDALQVLINIVPLQLLAYHIAILRGHDVDRPRGLMQVN